MRDRSCVEPESTLYLAGERVAAGFYRQLDVQVTIHLEQDDFLPASLDGHVACYVRIVPLRDLFSAEVAVVKTETSVLEGSNVREDTRVS